MTAILPIPDNPKLVAEKFAKDYGEKGYKLDFSLESLKVEIDKILEMKASRNTDEIEKLESELTAYFGETLCRVFKAEWKGGYYGYKNRTGINFYLCRIKKGEFEFGPSNFFEYYFSNGKENTGSFNDYLNFSYYYKGNKKYITDGLLKKINSFC
uniref:hypothetical protein n=1 Tax=Flavobacterium sp. TaxID=239 RepID=UPI0040496E05